MTARARTPTALVARRFGLAVALSLPFALSGCVGCPGEADWTDPGVSAWLDVHGKSAGLGPGQPLPGFTVGPRLSAALAALPKGAMLEEVSFRPDTAGGIHRDVGIYPGEVVLGAWKMEGGAFTPPTAQQMLEVLDKGLNATYRGNQSARTALDDQVRAEWPPPITVEVFSLHLNSSGPWDFDGVFPDGARFDTEGIGYHRVEAGGWTLEASSVHWEYDWGAGQMLELDGRDHALVRGNPHDTPEDLKGLVRSTFSGFGWTFEKFDYHKTPCSPI